MAANINLEGIVLHSPNIDKLSVFYESLLGITFKENISQNKRHFVGKLDNGPVLYLYPIPPAEQSVPNQPYSARIRVTDTLSLVFQVGDIDSVLQAIEAYTHGNVEKLVYGVEIQDPDGRAIYLHGSK